MATADARSRLAAAIQRMLKESREELFEPWRETLAAAKDPQAEIDRTVEALQVFFQKWAVEIIIVLGQHGTLRFNALRDRLEGISGRTLSQRLRDLEAQGLVSREMFDEMPVRVEYSLTPKGSHVAILALPLVLYLRHAA